jgi:hypothetical protein
MSMSSDMKGKLNLKYAEAVFPSGGKFGYLTDVCWRLPDSGQRFRRELGCDQMMTLLSLAMLLTLMGYKLFWTSKL